MGIILIGDSLLVVCRCVGVLICGVLTSGVLIVDVLCYGVLIRAILISGVVICWCLDLRGQDFAVLLGRVWIYGVLIGILLSSMLICWCLHLRYLVFSCSDW